MVYTVKQILNGNKGLETKMQMIFNANTMTTT